MRADNSHHVVAAARQRSRATRRRAIAALRTLDNAGTQVSFDAVAREARVSRSWLYGQPDLMHHILDINTRAVITYLNAQIDAGAQTMMVFDSWGGVLADGAFQRFSLDYTRRVVQGLQREKDGQRVPVIVFTKGGGPWLDEIAACGADVVGLDWTVNLGRARARVGSQVALQGNLDPSVLFAPPDVVAREAVAVLDSFGRPQRADGSWDGHVFNLGHGISQHTSPEHVSALCEAVHHHSRRLRATPDGVGAVRQEG